MMFKNILTELESQEVFFTVFDLDLTEFGGRLKYIQNSYGENNTEMAERLKIKDSYVSMIINKKRKAPSESLTLLIAMVYRCSYEWLLTGEGEPNIVKSPTPTNEASQGYDIQHMKDIIKGLEIALTQLNMNLKPDEKADVVPLLYKYLKREKKLTLDEIVEETKEFLRVIK